MNAADSTVWFSPRGLPLIYLGPPGPRGIVSVENYLKWYTLYVVDPTGKVVDVAALPRYETVAGTLERAAAHSCFGDHVFHPGFVEKLAEALGLDVDGVSLEAIAGRWASDHMELGALRYAERDL